MVQQVEKKPGEIKHAMQDGMMRITISNPDRLNAMSLSMWEALAKVVNDAQSAPDIRAIVLRGAGSKSFVSGADISEFGTQRNNPENVQRFNSAVDNAQQALIDSRVPTIAAVQGICIGGGMAMAISCDLRYCDDTSRFRMPAARIGLGYGLGGTRRLADMVGVSRAADLFFTARMFDGREASRIGLVHESFGVEMFDAMVEKRIEAVRYAAPLTVRTAKLALLHILDGPSAPSVADVEKARTACFESQDYLEGQQAFLEKRPAKFMGR